MNILTSVQSGEADLLMRRHGKWNTDIPYWVKSGLPLGYQNMTTAWVLGGDNIEYANDHIEEFI